MKRLIPLVLSALVLAGCASSPTVHTDADPSANFSGYRTYTWLSKPSDQQGVPPLAAQRVVEYVNAQLRAKGWTETANGDVAVAAHVATQQQQSLDTMYSGPAYGGWGWGPGWYGGMGMTSATTRVRTYTVGTLVVDLFDTKTKQAVWRGTASDTVPDDPAKGDALLRAGIADMFAGFPPGSAPAAK